MPVRSTSWAALAPAVVLAVLAGCSLLVDTDGLAGDPSAADGATAADVGATGADAARDGSGSTDAPLAGTYCAAQSPRHQFCADFDENPIGFGWSTVSSDPAISLDADPAASSPPTAVRSRVLVNSVCTFAMLSKFFVDPYSEAHFAFDLRMEADALASPNGMYVASLEVGKCNHLLQIDKSMFAVYTQIPPIDQPGGEDRQYTKVAVKPGEWMRLALDVDRRTGSIAFSVDGKPAFANVVLPKCTASAEVKMRVGLFCQSGPAEIRFDNVTFDGK